jgi:hypothetical protein
MLKSENIKTAKYSPKVLMTIRKKPKVRILIGISKTLIIGFKSNSNMVKTKATLIITKVEEE